jgi:hypothetical protein
VLPTPGVAATQKATGKKVTLYKLALGSLDGKVRNNRFSG